MKNEFSLNTTVWFLTIFFIILKLSGQVTWSWIWVMSPLWITGSVILIMTGVVIFLFLVKVVSIEDLEKFSKKEEN